ncbi:F510_1955 family glycosylhydrolase [Pelagibacterium lentulum]|uniref:Photosynthesis system II assembly factor Ycf48/Hcf136-like domain-containing protein n=1 Tax=Pelagibacterium lentulum TaxID=2029865 RepID=A0A916R9I2_9HYPH|nr:exo-alpha-sialidase [Pelagibacterium lentulum]GGA43444.1 hypothetical protein GCM10011499_11290 [Pelagibacterium lentulum]
MNAFGKLLAGAAFAALGAYSGTAPAQERLELETLLAQTHVHGLAPDRTRSDALLLATHHGLWSLDLETGLADFVGTSRDDFMGFSAHPQDHLQFWASGHPATGGNLGIIASQDGGRTWAKLSDGVYGPVDFHQMTVSPLDPDVLYGVHHGTSLQRSADGGVTWDEIGILANGLIDLAASAADPDTLYAASEAGLFKSEDAGRTWLRAHPGATPVTTIHVDGDGITAFVFGEGLMAASEEDLSWSLVTDRIGDGYLLHLTRLDDQQFAAISDQNTIALVADDGSIQQMD